MGIQQRKISRQQKRVQMQWALEKMPLYNTEKALPEYSKFETIEDFNRDWEMIMAIYRKKFTKLQHKVLKVVRQLAFVVPGVANARISIYIDKCREKLGHSVSRDTVRNTLDKAESLGILLKCHGRRFKDGHNSTTANVVVFNTYKEVYAYKVAKEELEIEEAKKELADHYKSVHRMLNMFGEAAQMVSEVEEQKEQQKAADAPKEPKSAPKQLENAPKEPTLYQNLKDTYKPTNDLQTAKFKELVAIIYKMMKDAKAKYNFNHKQLEQLMLGAMQTLVSMKGVNNPPAMLSVIIRKKIENLTKTYTSPNASKSPVSKEIEPEWFNSRNKKQKQIELSEEERELFEIERQKILAKLD